MKLIDVIVFIIAILIVITIAYATHKRKIKCIDCTSCLKKCSHENFDEYLREYKKCHLKE